MCCAKLEAELEIICTCEATRPKFFEALKTTVRQDTELEGGLVLLARPSLRSAVAKPTSWIYGWIKRKNGGAKPLLRTYQPSPTRPNWAITTGDSSTVIASGTVNSSQTIIVIAVTKRVTTAGLQLDGREMLSELLVELAKPYNHYPYEVATELHDRVDVDWIGSTMSAKGAKGRGRGEGSAGGSAGGRGSGLSPEERRGSGGNERRRHS